MPTKRKARATTKKPSKRKSRPYTAEERLEITIRFSERAVQDGDVDGFFTQQTARLKKELEELRKNK